MQKRQRRRAGDVRRVAAVLVRVVGDRDEGRLRRRLARRAARPRAGLRRRFWAGGLVLDGGLVRRLCCPLLLHALVQYAAPLLAVVSCTMRLSAGHNIKFRRERLRGGHLATEACLRV